MLDEGTIRDLTDKHYNGTIVSVERTHESLALFRVKPDFPIPDYKSGQYTTLGLGYWEPRHEEAVEEPGLDEKKMRRLVRRAYSVSHPVVNGGGELWDAEKLDFLEFYIVLVIGTEGQPSPGLTPRLFLKNVGERINIGQKFTGEYTLDCMAPIRNNSKGLVVFAGTGTGEGPHNRMIWELLSTGYKGQIASINVVRYKKDLAYEPRYRELEKKHPNISYHALTTRESDTQTKKVYVQDYIESGQFEDKIGRKMSPEDTHIYLCGNPAMLGVPKVREGEKIWPEGKTGVIQIMENRRFTMDYGKTKGNVHFEKYW
jgi:ferredoxin--NADP+ reductase